MIQSTVIGVDPGGTTGYCVYYQGHWMTMQGSTVEFTSWFVDWAYARRRNPTGLKVVVERFIPSTRHHSHQPDAQKVVGFLELYCAAYGYPFFLQTPAAAKGMAPNPLLKHIGAYAVKTPHGNDAARHVALYLSQSHSVEWREMLEGYVAT